MEDFGHWYPDYCNLTAEGTITYGNQGESKELLSLNRTDGTGGASFSDLRDEKCFSTSLSGG